MFLQRTLLLLCIILFPLNAAGGMPITLATLDWKPYTSTSIKGQGYAARVIQLAFKKSEYEATMVFFPWARTVHMAKQEGFAGYFPEYYSEKLTEDFLLSDPFPGGPLVLFKQKSNRINYRTLEDLKLYSFGVVRGYVNTAEFDNAAYLRKEEAKNDLQNLRKLLANRIDLVVADKYVGLHLLRTHFPERMNEIDYITKPLEKKQLYLCISRNHPQAEDIVNAFNKGLSALEKNGLLQQLIKESFPSGHLDLRH